MKTKDKKKQAINQGRVPTLRFPAFLPAGEWKKKSLGSVLSSIANGLSINQTGCKVGYKVTRIETISDKSINLNKVGYIQTDQDISSYKLCVGDILFSNINSLSHIGKVVIVDQDYDLYHGMNLLRLVVNKNTNDPYFLFYQLSTQKLKASFEARANKAVNQASINQTELKKTVIVAPTLPEQQKIADCLSALDELIAAQAQKLDTLKAHKKGLMQQLFPAPGQATPTLRFPEFWNTGEWEKKQLDEIATFHKGKGISKADIDPQGVTPCVRYGELYTCYQEEIKSVISKTNIPAKDLFLSCNNDVLIPSSGETKIDIATASCLLLDNVAIGGDINVVRCNQNGRFLSYYLNAWKKFEIAKIAQGDAVVHLYINQLKLLNINIPKPAEQQKIADCLSSLDELIVPQAHKLDTLKAHKKGLMQQLFPNPDGGG